METRLLCPNPLVLCDNSMCSENCRRKKVQEDPFGVEFFNMTEKEHETMLRARRAKKTGLVMKFKKEKLCSDPQDVPIEVDGGQFWEEFKIEKILTPEEKNSASNSVIAFGQHVSTGRSIVVKTFSEYEDKRSDVFGMLYEVRVFEALRKLATAVPHFVKFVASYTYNDSDLPADEIVKDLLFSGDHNARKAHMHHITVSTRVMGYTLGQILMVGHQPEVVRSLLFQLLFCLHCMNMLGFQHNDLHIENVLVATDLSCNRAIYYLDGHEFSVPIYGLKIYIYDFDLASCGECGPNGRLDEIMDKDRIWRETENPTFCQKFGVCNERNSRFDLFTIFSYINDRFSYKFAPEIRKMIIESLGGPEKFDLSNRITQKFKFRMCDLDMKTYFCRPFRNGEPNFIKTPRQVIMEYFKDFII